MVEEVPVVPVKLVAVEIDTQAGRRRELEKVLDGAVWQRPASTSMRNLLSVVPKGTQDTVAALVQTIFAQADLASAMSQLRDLVVMPRPGSLRRPELLENAAEDTLAHMRFPREHRRRLHSTNPLERHHKEIKRRTNVIGIFPNRASLVRMVATLLQEQDDGWEVTGRRY